MHEVARYTYNKLQTLFHSYKPTVSEMKQLLVLLVISVLISIAVCAPTSSQVFQQEDDIRPNSGRNRVNKLLMHIKRSGNAESAAALVQAILKAGVQDMNAKEAFTEVPEGIMAATESLAKKAQAQVWWRRFRHLMRICKQLLQQKDSQ